MYIQSVKIQNFRQLEFIEEEFHPGINVIVGRNGVGKSNILEAIRLPKALLAPRTQSEATQSLLSLNAMSPHNQQVVLYEALAGNKDLPIDIQCNYNISDSELKYITNNIPQISGEIVRSQLGAQPVSVVAAYLSSPAGQAALQEAQDQILSTIDLILSSGNCCRLWLHMEPGPQVITTPYPIESQFIGFLDRALPFDLTKFTYFPADRALPRGEVGIQLGQQEAGQSLESHNSQPHLKYGRLKNMIFNAILASPEGREDIRKDFDLIFNNILPGRELSGVGVSEYGLLSIKIKDVKSGRIFDIDQMSSGEKSLVLSFLILSRGISERGVVLMDEPELHLHPSVCKELIPFLSENYISNKKVQMIICSHSPQILSGAFARDDCRLYHLMNGVSISPVEPSNKPFIEETLLALGTSETEGLIYRAIVSVEGREDVEILEEGFPQALQSYMIKPQGSKNEVLSAIKNLKEIEKEGMLRSTHFFIFDNDSKPANEKSTQQVKILEWDRYCIENYLIDSKIIARVLKDKSVAKKAPPHSGDVKERLRKLAFRQVQGRALVQAFDCLMIPWKAIELKAVYGMHLDEAMALLSGKLDELSLFLSGNSKITLTSKFERTYQDKIKEIEQKWQSDWPIECNGKQLFHDIYEEFELNISIAKFKKRIISEMRADHDNKNWRAWRQKLEGFLVS